MRIIYVILFYILITLGVELLAQDREAPNEAISDLMELLRKNKNDIKALRQISELLINKGDYAGTIYYSGRLDSVARMANDETAQMYACIYLGQAMMMNGETVEAKFYLDQSLQLAEKLADDSALASVYNGLGLYASNIELDHYRSIEYFFKGIEAAKRSENKRLYSLLLCNISGIYYLKKDPEGLQYALECYNVGHENRDPFLIYCGASNSAYMLFLLQEYDEALKYIKEAEFLTEKNGFFNQTNLYNLYGNILLESGDKDAAMEMFHRSLQYKGQSQASAVANTYLGISKAYIKENQHKKAIEALQLGLDVSTKNSNTIYILELHRYMSQAYELQGDLGTALAYYKTYHSLADSIFNVDKERSLNELRIKYDTEKKDNELKQSKLVLLQKDKNMQRLFFILGVILIVLCGTYISYYKKNKLYLAIVKQNQESIRRELQLQNKIKRLNAVIESQVPEKYATSSLTDEKKQYLFECLETLLIEEKIFTDNLLTKEKVADMLGTNRTYLSQIINEHTKQTFTQFVNSFRTKEAVRLLSDPNNSTPLKALSADLGFNSMTTFYNLFQVATGMTPTQYRNKAQQLQKKD